MSDNPITKIHFYYVYLNEDDERADNNACIMMYGGTKGEANVHAADMQERTGRVRLGRQVAEHGVGELGAQRNTELTFKKKKTMANIH